MENPRKKSRVSVDDEDRISNLPESVISHILSFLPTKTGVATSVLSKTWKSLWTKVTSLDFTLSKDGDDDIDNLVVVPNDDFDIADDVDANDVEVEVEFEDDDVEVDEEFDEVLMSNVDREAQKVRRFVQFVNKVLLTIDSQRLQKFQLNWWQGCHREPEYIPIWISYAIARSIRELTITTLSPSALHLHLPLTLFTSATLELLTLYVPMVMKVPNSVHLPRLKHLDLGALRYKSSECIPKLILGCPALHSVRIARDGHDTMRDFKVSSPSLRCLHISRAYEGLRKPFDGKLEIDAPNLEWFVLDEVLRQCSVIKRLTSLHSVELNLDHDVLPHWNESYAARCNSTVKLLEAMHNVKFLKLEGTIIKALRDATTPLSVRFERLVALRISVQCCDWDSLCDILGRATKLQVLDITKVGCGNNVNTTTDDHRLCWNEPAKVPECLLSSLREASFANFEGLEDEMAMVKYILQRGEVLKSFTFKCGDGDPGMKFQQWQRTVSMFHRCSRDCRIQVIGDAATLLKLH